MTTMMQRLDYPLAARVHVFVDPRVVTLTDHNRSPIGAAFEVKVSETIFCMGECKHGTAGVDPCTRFHKHGEPGEGPCNGYLPHA